MVGCISPWNLPLYLFTWKIAPALAAGNAVVAKPSEITPATATMLGELALKVGLPPGVLNIVHGLGPAVERAAGNACAGQRSGLVHRQHSGGSAHSRVDRTSAEKISLELGGKNATLIFADSDWRANLDTLVRSAFQNSGQICLLARAF